jgi:hypothetical protein
MIVKYLGNPRLIVNLSKISFIKQRISMGGTASSVIEFYRNDTRDPMCVELETPEHAKDELLRLHRIMSEYYDRK